MSRQQRLTTWLAAVTVMIGSLGVPLSPQRAARNGAAFPCQDCPCGCSDAETCWRDCCCFTNRQKVVWAEKNGVKVPLFVTVAARREHAKGPAKRDCCSEQGVCDAGDQATCCSEDAIAGRSTPSCCEKKPAAAPANRGKVVLLLSALKCRGISVSIGLLPPSLPPAHEAISLATVELGPRPVVAVTLYEPPSHDVATPPPDARDLFAS